MTDPARLAHGAIVRRVCQQTGLDGHAASLIVLDVGHRGTASPFFGIVRPGAQAVMAEFVRPLAPTLDQIAKTYAAFFAEVGRAMTRLIEQYRPATEAIAKLAHDYDKAQHPRRHARECPTCRETRQ